MAGGQQLSDEEPITDINVTPLVDVSLVLVIIFMAISPFGLQAGIKVLQSKAGESQGKASASENVSVQLTKEGKLTVNGEESSFATLRESLLKALAKSKDRMVGLSADEENRVGQVVEVLDTARQADARKLAIMRTAKPGAERKG